MSDAPRVGRPGSLPLCFGAFELDVRAGELRKHGVRLRLQEQPFHILLMLLEHPGQVVLREEIRKTLWPNGTIVEFGPSINAAIQRLRDALGDSADEPRYVETVARRGYRFIGELQAQPENAPGSPLELPPENGHGNGTPPPAPVADGKLDSDDLTGTTISHYRVFEKLGSGGMGVVYRAEDLMLGRQVALKFLPDELVRDPAARQRFERESRAAAALNHPNICTVYGVEECVGHPILAMEILEGETLESRLARGTLPHSQTVALAAQIASALDAAHRKGIVHRDLKPGNVMLTKSGVKVLDFGLAKMQPAISEEEEEETQANLTKVGAILGTLQYMAPEQVQGQETDARSDIFSFGLVLYEMVTGRRAFEEPSRAGLIAAILQNAPDWEKVPPALERVTKKCLAKDPDARWQSAAGLRDELEWVAREPAASGGPAPARFRLAWKPALAVMAAIAIALAVGIQIADRPLVDVSHVRFTPMVMEPGYNGRPQWSPDGRSFVYNHNGELMLRSLDAPTPARLATHVQSIVYSRDGKRLYWRYLMSDWMPFRLIWRSVIPSSTSLDWCRSIPRLWNRFACICWSVIVSPYRSRRMHSSWAWKSGGSH